MFRLPKSERLEKLAIILLIFLLCLTMFYIITTVMNGHSDGETTEQTPDEMTLEPMQMTEREEDIVHTMGSDHTLAYDISLPSGEEFVLDYWIEQYHKGEKLDNPIEYSFNFRSDSSMITFILNETDVYQSGQHTGYLYKGILLDESGFSKVVTHSSVPYQKNTLTLFDKVEDQIPIEINKEIILATKIQARADSLTFRGIFDENDPHFKTMIKNSRDAYIYKMKIRSD